jgi:hypothetical protein
MDITVDQISEASAAEQLPGRGLVTIARVTEVWEAHIIRARLQAEGLLATLADEHLVSMDWLYSNAIGGVRVQVPEREVPRALAVLAAVSRGEYALEEDLPYGDVNHTSDLPDEQ